MPYATGGIGTVAQNSHVSARPAKCRPREESRAVAGRATGPAAGYPKERLKTPPGRGRPLALPKSVSLLRLGKGRRFRLPGIPACTVIASVLVGVSTMPYAAAGRPAEPTQPDTGGGTGFVEVTAQLGLDYRLRTGEGEASSIDWNREGGGLALVDIDQDGRLELYVAHARGEVGRLFSWNGQRFQQTDGNRGIEPAAVDRAGYFIDLDQDGRPDFISIQSKGGRIFRNDGDGGFVDATSHFDPKSGRTAYSMAAADIDSDGDLDLFFAHWGRPWNGHRPPSHYLWRNDGGGRYEDVSHLVPVKPATIPGENGGQEMSFTPIFSDIDGDGDPDLLLTADFGSTQVLRNDFGVSFVDITGSAITDENGMGAAVGDFDRDGDQDWFVTSIYDASGETGFGLSGNRLYRNLGNGTFADATEVAGVREGGWGWGACVADFDNDGHPDLFQTNGWFGHYVQDPSGGKREIATFLNDPSRLFMSNGDGTFTERASALGIDHAGQGRGVVCADYDNDGRVDIFIANHGAGPSVYRNGLQSRNRWLKIELAGRHGNPHAVGARVTVRTASGSQVQEVRFGGSYLSQSPPVLHFGLGGDPVAHSVEIRWPGPGNRTSLFHDIPANRRLTIREPAPEGFLLQVVRGTAAGLHASGDTVPVIAERPRSGYRFSHWTDEGGGAFRDPRSPRTVFTMPEGPATVFAHFLPGPPLSDTDPSVARRWMEVLLQAIRDDVARPTVHARNLFHLSAAMYDAWAAHDPATRPYLAETGDALCRAGPPPAATALHRAREEAISHAAWRLIRHRFRRSPGSSTTARNADTLMSALGYEADSGSSAAAALGKRIAETYIAHGLDDGSNEANDYASRFYRPVNPYLLPWASGNSGLTDPDRWQPLRLEHHVDQAGFVLDDPPGFVSPEWGRVEPFALAEADLSIHERGEGRYFLYHDPGPPPTLRGRLSAYYRWGFALVARWSAQLSPDDGVLLDIAPSGIGNVTALPRRLEDYPQFYATGALGQGREINPATGRPYARQIVPRGDYARVLAEFWADGPNSETPPGHWFAILNAVNDHELTARRLGGKGPVLDRLEWDIKTYFTLGGAMHDAAIAAWGIKGWYDYVRPISALRAMAGHGQSTDPGLQSWSADGIPLADGFIELVQSGDPLAGEKGQHVGKVKVLAWRGPGHLKDPAKDVAGVGWILAENWWPYQRPSFVTPPFAGYVSGHSTFSRAAAEVLTLLTGDPFFPGGMGEFRIPANEFLTFERGPSVDMTLQWATYRDAADQSALSRIWGGIHPPVDDIPGRLIGAEVGRDAFGFATSHFRRRPGPLKPAESCDSGPNRS